MRTYDELVSAIIRAIPSTEEIDAMSPKQIMRYEHDCSKCKPLGEFHEYDLYYCDQDAIGMPTVIARYGTDGDYLSGLRLASMNPALFEAKRRATEAGYLSIVR